MVTECVSNTSWMASRPLCGDVVMRGRPGPLARLSLGYEPHDASLRCLAQSSTMAGASANAGEPWRAVTVSNASASTLASYPVAGGRPTAWLRLGTGGMNYIIDPAG